MPKPRNIIIFVVIGIIFILIYIFFIKKAPNASTTATLVSSSDQTSQSGATSSGTSAPDANSQIAKDFLTLLLNVKNIKLNDAIFSDPAFLSLHDSSIILTPDGTEGRPNPFAPLGSDVIAIPVNPLNTTTPASTPPTYVPTPAPTPISH